jgi:hypothetical protein
MTTMSNDAATSSSRKSARFADARAALPAGSSRARVTSANARWARAAEERDRIARQLDQLRRGTP